jgi:hypothetical protein
VRPCPPRANTPEPSGDHDRAARLPERLPDVRLALRFSRLERAILIDAAWRPPEVKVSRVRRVFVAGVLAACLPLAAGRPATLSASARGQQGGGRQGGAATPNTPPATATALILGHVVDGSSGEPIPEAVVTLRTGGARGRAGMPQPTGNPATDAAMEAVMANLQAGRGRGSTDQRLLTGADGRFVYHSLAPGNYSISASLDGYAASPGLGIGRGGLVAAMPSTETPSSLVVTEGQILRDVKLRLWKLGSIAGTVLDDLGDPAVGLTVQVMRRLMVAGRARYLPAGNAKTDDRGVFRIGRLIPADYIVVVPQTQTAFPAALLDRAMKGVFNNDLSGSLDLVDVMGSGVAPPQSMGAGVRIGPYMVSAAGGAMPLPGPDGRLLVYQTAFYAGGTVPTQATVVSLKSGEERAAADFQLRLIPTARVSGMLSHQGGSVANIGVKLVVPGDGVTSDSEFEVATSVTTADGSFTFFGVPAGQFVLRASKASRPDIPAGANPMAAGMLMAGGTAPMTKALFAERTITVGATDISDLALPLQEGFTLNGRIEFQGTTGKPAPARPQISVTLAPADGRTPGILDMVRPNRLSETNTFTLGGLMPGKYFLNVPAPPGWFVQSASIGGRDVWDTSLEIRNGDIDGLLITLTDVNPQLTGTVTATGEQKVLESTVVVFPADHKAWIEGGMNPRRVRALTPGPKGEFTVAGVGTGDYLIVAIDRGDDGDLQDPAYIELLSRLARPVRISTDSRPVTLPITRVVRK